MAHLECTVQYFKIIKNAKKLHGELDHMLNVIVNPNDLTEQEVNEFLISINSNSVNDMWNYFKDSNNKTMKQKLSGFMLRMTCSKKFCEELTKSSLSFIRYFKNSL